MGAPGTMERSGDVNASNVKGAYDDAWGVCISCCKANILQWIPCRRRRRWCLDVGKCRCFQGFQEQGPYDAAGCIKERTFPPLFSSPPLQEQAFSIYFQQSTSTNPTTFSPIIHHAAYQHSSSGPFGHFSWHR